MLGKARASFLWKWRDEPTHGSGNWKDEPSPVRHEEPSEEAEDREEGAHRHLRELVQLRIFDERTVNLRTIEVAAVPCVMEHFPRLAGHDFRNVWDQPLVEQGIISVAIPTIIPTRAGPAGSLGWSEMGSPRPRFHRRLVRDRIAASPLSPSAGPRQDRHVVFVTVGWPDAGSSRRICQVAFLFHVECLYSVMLVLL